MAEDDPRPTNADFPLLRGERPCCDAERERSLGGQTVVCFHCVAQIYCIDATPQTPSLADRRLTARLGRLIMSAIWGTTPISQNAEIGRK